MDIIIALFITCDDSTQERFSRKFTHRGLQFKFWSSQTMRNSLIIFRHSWSCSRFEVSCIIKLFSQFSCSLLRIVLNSVEVQYWQNFVLQIKRKCSREKFPNQNWPNHHWHVWIFKVSFPLNKYFLLKTSFKFRQYTVFDMGLI